MSTKRKPERDVAESDRDLMAYFDDELDEQRLAAMADRFDAEARAKLAGLALTRELLRERAEADPRADGIADAVMAAIESGSAFTRGAPEPRGADRDEDDDNVVPLPKRPQLSPPGSGAESASAQLQPVSTDRPANDNARLLYGMAAMAAAVAIVLFFWGGSGSTELASLEEAVPAAPAAIEATTRREAPAQPTSAPAAEEPEDQPAVEVASVDFGSNAGSVFYLPGHAGATTAVVWVTDQGSEL